VYELRNFTQKYRKKSSEIEGMVLFFENVPYTSRTST